MFYTLQTKIYLIQKSALPLTHSLTVFRHLSALASSPQQPAVRSRALQLRDHDTVHSDRAQPKIQKGF